MNLFILKIKSLFITFFLLLLVFSCMANTIIPEIPKTKPNEMQWRQVSNLKPPSLKPNPSFFMLSIPTTAETPKLKPAISSFFPEAKNTLTEMIFKRTNLVFEQSAVKILRLKKNEGINPLLQRAGFSPSESHKIAVALGKIINLKKLPVGLEVQCLPPLTNTPGALVFKISKHFNIYGIQDKNGLWDVIKALRPISTEVVSTSGEINSSLYLSAIEANLPEDALLEFVKLMGYSVDFQREIQKGDTFRVLFSQSYDVLEQRRIGIKDLIYAELNLSGETIRFYRYVNKDGTPGYYNENGLSAKKTLMKTPINGARLSSGFGMRMHPIKNYSAMHKGVDFAAPSGTPIYAAGDGILEKVGWLNGYGRYILIRHNSTYKTAYAHLKGWAKGIKRGSRVSQGQIIGFVGSSGNSTGPHLHYEVLVNNIQKNPLKLRFPSGKPIPKDEIQIFKKKVYKINSRLKNLLNI